MVLNNIQKSDNLLLNKAHESLIRLTPPLWALYFFAYQSAKLNLQEDLVYYEVCTICS